MPTQSEREMDQMPIEFEHHHSDDRKTTVRKASGRVMYYYVRETAGLGFTWEEIALSTQLFLSASLSRIVAQRGEYSTDDKWKVFAAEVLDHISEGALATTIKKLEADTKPSDAD